jgi:hypothetical protein
MDDVALADAQLAQGVACTLSPDRSNTCALCMRHMQAVGSLSGGANGMDIDGAKRTLYVGTHALTHRRDKMEVCLKLSCRDCVLPASCFLSQNLPVAAQGWHRGGTILLGQIAPCACCCCHCRCCYKQPGYTQRGPCAAVLLCSRPANQACQFSFCHAHCCRSSRHSRMAGWMTGRWPRACWITHSSG